MDTHDPLTIALARLFSRSNAAAPSRWTHEAVAGALAEFSARERVHSGAPEAELAARFGALEVPALPAPLEEYLDVVLGTIVEHAVNVASPRCLAHMSGATPAFQQRIAEVVVALNQNLVKFDASRTAALVERQVLAMLHRLTYGGSDQLYDDHLLRDGGALGVVASGGTLANVTALWCARNAAFAATDGFAGVEREGLAAALRYHGFERAVVVGSRLMHYSIQKAAGLLGLGTGGVVSVPLDRHYRIDVPALVEALDACERRRWRVIAVVGVAGTTDCGSLDPLAALADVAGQRGLHFHVDAAWGAPLLFSAHHRGRLAGIERADTVTIDGHKQLHLPIGAAMLLFRHPAAARHLEKEAHYVLRKGSLDPGKHTLEGSRPAMALFAHAALHVIGARGYERLIDGRVEMARAMAEMISASSEFELLVEPQTNIVVYRWVPPRFRHGPRDDACISAVNEAIHQTQNARGASAVARTTLDGAHGNGPVVALRAVIGNPRTTAADLAAVLAEQAAIGAELDATLPDRRARTRGQRNAS